ncbi:hypothetical protein ScPMuIL_010555 [Solemya velum]
MSVPASSIQSPGAAKNPKLASIKDVDIDKHGKFKYILIKVHDPEKDREFKHIVRGTNKAEYHADIYDGVVSEIEKKNLDCECVGGGRINHEHSKKHIQIYGYSQGYGRAEHAITAHILRRKFSNYDEITWHNDGY